MKISISFATSFPSLIITINIFSTEMKVVSAHEIVSCCLGIHSKCLKYNITQITIMIFKVYITFAYN